MSEILCTFSGPHGDILWSLPTVRAIAAMLGSKRVDFCCMPYYESLIPLLSKQSYIRKAFVAKNWIREHSNHGDQPWLPPASVWNSYGKSFHLTYKGHPGITAKRLPLIDFTADQQGIRLVDPLPFIEVPEMRVWELPEKRNYIAYAFNVMYAELKTEFLTNVKKNTKATMVNVAELPWLDAAYAIKNAIAFVGCRSANYVLAHGVGQCNIFIYEPHPARNANGHLGDIFGCPYAREITAPWLAPPEVCAEVCIHHLKEWSKFIEEESLRA